MDFSALNTAVLDVFGDDAEGLLVSIGGMPIQAIYDSRHFADETGEAGASDLITTISVSTASVPAMDDDTAIIARGTLYRRWEVRTDGQGMTVIQLERIGVAPSNALIFSDASNSQYLPLLEAMIDG